MPSGVMLHRSSVTASGLAAPRPIVPSRTYFQAVSRSRNPPGTGGYPPVGAFASSTLAIQSCLASRESTSLAWKARRTISQFSSWNTRPRESRAITSQPRSASPRLVSSTIPSAPFASASLRSARAASAESHQCSRNARSRIASRSGQASRAGERMAIQRASGSRSSTAATWAVIWWRVGTVSVITGLFS